MDKTMDATRGGTELATERAGSPAQAQRGVVTGLAGLGLDVADTLVTTLVGVLDVVREETHRSTNALIDMSENVALSASKAARAAAGQLNQASASILQAIARSAHDGIAGTRTT